MYTPSPDFSVFYTPNIMHEYVETERKYTGTTGLHSMWGANAHNTLRLKIMPSEASLKNFEI